MLEKNITLDISTTFSFKCKLCGNCCKQMLIRLTPYDIINLANCLSLQTYDFITDYVVFLKAPNVPWFLAALKHVKKGECLFRKGKKCKVHAYRPLPCRLFPVGRKNDDEYILQITNYCKGHNSNTNYSLQEWIKESEALPYLKMSQKFYGFMERVARNHNLVQLSAKNKNLFYKLIYDYDSASLESTICLEKAQDKAEFCLNMAEWFLNYLNDKGKDVSDEVFLEAYESQAALEEKKIKSK